MGRRITDDKKGGVEFGKFRRNIMGTTSFEFKLPNMRKMQDFIVYPATSGDTSIMIQSGTRIGRINMSNGEGIMSQSHASGAYGVHLQFDKLIPFLLTADQLSALKEQVAKTAGSSVGSSVVKSDNSGADKFAKGGKLKPTYIPNEDIESIKTRFGQTFSGKDVLDGAYVKGEVKTPKVARYMFEEEEYEYAEGGTMGSSTYGLVGFLNEVPDKIYLVTIVVTDWNNDGSEHIFWGLEVRTQSGDYVRYIQNAYDFLNFRSTLDSKDIKLMRDFNQEADRTKTNEIIDGLVMTEIPPIYTSYSNVQHYGGAEEGGWYYHTREAIEEVTEAQYLEIESERLDSYGEGVSASAGFIFGEDEKLGREYYS